MSDGARRCSTTAFANHVVYQLLRPRRQAWGAGGVVLGIARVCLGDSRKGGGWEMECGRADRRGAPLVETSMNTPGDGQLHSRKKSRDK